MWQNWIDESEWYTFLKGGYYTKLIHPKLRLIVLNCLYTEKLNFMDRFKSFGENYNDPGTHIEWLYTVIKKAYKNNEKVWIVGHVFPNSGEAQYRFKEAMIDLVYKYNTTILNQFWGHAHSDFFILYTKNNKSYAHGYIPGSIVPSEHNPTFRVYTYNRDTYEIINYYQYTLNIEQLNSGNMVDYKLEYDAKSSYHLNDLNSDSWQNLYDRMQTNNTLFDIFRQHNLPGNTAPCDHTCKKYLFADIIEGLAK